jgi:hypothetical protein
MIPDVKSWIENDNVTELQVKLKRIKFWFDEDLESMFKDCWAIKEIPAGLGP